MRFPVAAGSVALALAVALAAPAVAQRPAPDRAGAERLTPERMFSPPDLSGPAARGVAFSPDGRLVTFLRPKETDATVLDLWAVPASGGEPRLLVDSAGLETGRALSEAEVARRERMRVSSTGIVSYDWDSQGRQILVPVSGDLWLAQASDGSLRRLTETPGDEVDAKISPRGGLVSFVRNNRLYVLDIATGRERAISPAPTDTVSWGVAEFIAQEELGRYTGQWWSPDDRRIAYTRVDESGVDILPRFEIGPEGVAVANQRYPRAGRPNAVVQLFVQPLAGGRSVRVDLGANADIYLARVNWSKDGRTLYVQRLSRDQRRLDLLAVDPATGRSRVLLSETSPHWVNLHNDFRALGNGGFLWSSERSGYNHLYLYAADGRLVRQVTRGDWPVRGVVGLDEAAGLAYFTASPEQPTEQHLHAVDYRTGAAPRRLTTEPGWWTATFSGGSGGVSSYAATYSTADRPPATALYAAADGRRLRWIEENALNASHPFWPYRNRSEVSYGSIRGPSGDALQYMLITPADVRRNPNRRRPAIVHVYGGPHSQQVTRQWTGALGRFRMLADHGYVVFVLDNRGSPNRGVAFEAALDRRMGTVEVEDQMAGVAWLRARPFVDPARTGVMGWSYGGYMTLLMATARDNGFAAAAAGAAPIDWRYYDTGYTERYMGTPQDNLAGYDAGSTLRSLQNLQARLLILHGMADDNVTFDNATRLSAALQQRGVVFEQMFYPGQRHGVRPPALQRHQWRTYLDFFHRTLGGDPPQPLAAAPASAPAR